MVRRGTIFVLAGMGILLAAQPVLAQRQGGKLEFTSDNVEKAIAKGCAWLLTQQQEDGSWPAFISGMGKNMKLGPTGMAIYTLIASGVPASDPKVQKALEWLVKNDVPPTDQEPSWTYDKAFACLAYFAANKQTQKKYAKQLDADVKLLYMSNNAGKFDYNPTGKPPTSSYYDNSNSQYGLYGVWTGARAGIEIPKEFWQGCLKHWLGEQQTDGGWKYRSGEERESYPHMTVAGLASLFVCIDYLMADKFVKCETANEYAPVKKGLDWIEKHFAGSLDPRQGNFHYYLYGVERVGLASGYKYFGPADWYKTGATILLNTQNEDGSWSTGHSRRQDCKLHANFDSTGYALLFLARGRLPVLFNRLEYDGDWNNRPRALANFCRWGEGVYETEVNWQIVTLKSAAEEWHDAAILTITGSKAPKFSDEDIAKLRTYVNQGGTIFGITECNGSAAFGKAMRDLYQKLFPRYELTPCGRDHILNSIQYKLPANIRLLEVNNGIRPLIIHADADLPLPWQLYQVATNKPSFETAANVIMYVTDKQLKNRGSTIWPADLTKAAAKTIKVARIRYAGNYDPEPLALQRLSRLMWKLHDIRLDYESVSSSASQPESGPAAAAGPVTGLAVADLTSDVKIAFMTGTNAFKLTAKEKSALKKWVDAGGLLVIDAGGGAKSFGDAAKDLISELWGADSLLPLPLSSPVYQLKDMSIDKVKYRRITRARIGGIKEPRLLAVLTGEKPRVIFSAEDITGGLVGYSSYGCDGYESESALDIFRNILLYSISSTAATAASAPAAGGK